MNTASLQHIIDDGDLEQEMDALQIKKPMVAAEYAYALARRNRDRGDILQAQKFAQKAIDLLRSIPSQTMSGCATTNTVLGGVALPSLLHEDVVRDRFKDILVP